MHTCLKDPVRTLDDSFGPVRMRVNTKSARGGKPKVMPLSTITSVLGFLVSLVRTRVDGSYKNTPFFAPDRGTPVVPPKVLTRSEREQVTNVA